MNSGWLFGIVWKEQHAERESKKEKERQSPLLQSAPQFLQMGGV
jgi:hypothetical protein